MEIVNTSYPRGNKFYEVHDSKHAMCRKVFCLKMYDAAKHISTYAGISNETLGSQRVSPWVSSLELVGEHIEFPKFKIESYIAFRGVCESINNVILHKKSNYQSIERIRDLGNMPWEAGMVIQWDDIRKGFIVFDVLYEGELETVPKSGISKAITEILKDIVAEAGMFELLGESTYVAHTYSNSLVDDANFRDAFEALLNGTHTTKQATDIALGSGAYSTMYDSDENVRLNSIRNKLGNNAPHDYRYYKLVKTVSKPKISTVTRTLLLYKYGGLKLPENYEEWFDG